MISLRCIGPVCPVSPIGRNQTHRLPVARSVMKHLLITLLTVVSLNAAEITHPELRKELLAAAKADQDIRRQLIAKGMKNPDQSLLLKMLMHDMKHQASLKAIIAEHGWPTRKMVGANGVQAAFLILQHANRDAAFQKSMLPALKKSYETGDIRGNQIALLTDRILVGEGKPQLYGTQANMVDGKPVFNKIKDPENLDQRRAELGLQPHAKYKEFMSKTYQLNQDQPADEGRKGLQPK